MYLLINYKQKKNLQLYNLFKSNYNDNKEFPPDYQYSMILQFDYWFSICNDANNIIASCSVVKETDNIYEINDVLVEEKFRGNNYSVLLIMNILHYFEEHFQNVKIKIVAYLNTPAYYCYLKIFDKPYKCDDKFAYFSHKI